MIITRWQAPSVPTADQVKMIFAIEGLEPREENFPGHTQVPEHRHPFDEILMVTKGNLLLNVSGNRLLLYPGDKIHIPSNTRHSYQVNADDECQVITAQKLF